MKLMFKINLVALAVLTAVGLAIATAGVSTISRESYVLNQEVMSREVDNIVALIQNGYSVLAENRLEEVESYKNQAQAEVLGELSDFSFRKSGILIILNNQDTVVTHPQLDSGQKIDIQNIDELFRNGKGSVEMSYRGYNRLFSYKFFPQWNWLVILSVSSEEMQEARTKFIGQVIGILLVSLFLGAWVFIWFIRKVVEPVRQLASATAYVSEGKWDAPLPHPKGSDEVAQLTIAFRSMAERLAEMYGNLRENIQQIEQSQSALKESEEKYRGLVELLPLAVYEITPEGHFVFANKYAVDTFGYSVEELANDYHISDMLIEDDKESIAENMKDVLAGKNIGMMEFTAKKKDGSSFPCIFLATPILHLNKAIGIRAIIIDITERKALINELQQAREFLDTILNNVADPIFVKDTDHRYVLINDAFCNLVKCSHDEIIGKTEHDFFQEEESKILRKQDDLVFASPHPNEKEETITGNDGKQLVVLIKKAVFTDSAGAKLLVGIIKDITKRKKMEQELFKSDKLKSIGVLAGGIAHDFNNILTAIIGNLSLAKMLSEQESKLQQHIIASVKASNQAKNLTQQLLTFSRGGAPVKQTVSLSALISDLITFTLRGSNVRCELDLADDLWPVDVDEGQFSRVIHNLIVNASEAMPEGGTVHISAFNNILQTAGSLPLKPGPFVHITVKDHGVGIPNEDLTSIFDPYFTTKDDGSGLGLATAFSIIQRHDGYIGVESEVNVGTTFNIYLPASNEAAHTTEIVEEATVHHGQGKIMVMDDEPLVREVLGEMLTSLGYSVEFAKDGIEALEKYKLALNSDQPIDLVIMDLTIPGGMGGQEAVVKLLQLDSKAKAIVASGYSSDPVMADFKQYGFQGVVTKPFQLEKLSLVLHQVLDNTKE